MSVSILGGSVYSNSERLYRVRETEQFADGCFRNDRARCQRLNWENLFHIMPQDGYLDIQVLREVERRAACGAVMYEYVYKLVRNHLDNVIRCRTTAKGRDASPTPVCTAGLVERA